MHRQRLLHAGLVAAALLPAASLAARGFGGGLGANPIEEVTHTTGEWALRLLLASLAVTPVRRWLGLRGVVPFRRTLGLLAFGYACLHFSTWLVLDHFFDWELIVEDVLERRFITVGFASFALLVPLAVTSTRAMMRRLGRRWNALHRLVYAAAVGGVVHFLWLVKADSREPLVYAAVLALLLGSRLWPRRSALSRAGPVAT